MSATDSDNSIDWLASDNEENESELECDCTSKHGQTTDASPPPLAAAAAATGPPFLDQSDINGRLHRHHRRSSVLREGGGSWSEVSQVRGSPDCAEKCGLCKAPQGERINGRNTQRALKRPHGSTEEEEEEEERGGRQLNELDRLFSRKCVELQCYIHPLSSILNGLRSGRYKERLSSFQESVAMDRIQRIMGVLRNPYMGEKYIDIILKMEEMLKSWFPNVKLQEQLAATQTEEAVPVKKAKLSPVTCPAAASPAAASEPAALRVTDLTPPGAYSANHLKWLHTSPICSPTAEQAQAGPRPLPLSPRDLTQDNAVSSSTDNNNSSGGSVVSGGGAKTNSVPRGPPPGKINAPCLERLLKSTDSIITRNRTGNLMDSSWS